jgi:hypothetical protein
MSHALLSASGSKRWMACTPSARFEQQFEDRTSTFAEEGTLAHALAEAKLRLKYDKDYTVRHYNKDLKWIKEVELYGPSMDDYTDAYVDKITEIFNGKSKDAKIYFEQRLDYSDWVQEGFGTGDVLIIDDGTLEVIDLKYGKGVAVDAEDNPQLKLYGLGAYSAFSLAFDIQSVRMTIIQPRLDSITSCELLVEDLLEWAEKYVRPKAEMAFKGEGDFEPGGHCQFCKGAAVCKARAKYNLDLESYRCEHPNLLMADEIADILGRVDELVKWADKVKGYALEQAEKHGIKWPGWKLVEGRSNRILTEKEVAAERLLENGFEEDQLYEKSLLGMTNLEKVVGKKKFDEILGDLIIKPTGKPVLVPESDKRPEIGGVSSAVSDFTD